MVLLHRVAEVTLQEHRPMSPTNHLHFGLPRCRESDTRLGSRIEDLKVRRSQVRRHAGQRGHLLHLGHLESQSEPVQGVAELDGWPVTVGNP